MSVENPYSREAAIAERCVQYQKQKFWHDISYSAGYQGHTEPAVELMIMSGVLRLDLIELGVTQKELYWIAWELQLQEEWYSLQEIEVRQDPRLGTQLEVES